MIRLEKEAKLTSGWYNAMEANHPVFIDSGSLSDVVKQLLGEKGLNNEFCSTPFNLSENIDNPLIGKRLD